jgi:heme-degrading monooxygenase HmoA
MAEHYASGNWHVTKGREDEFIELWNDFLQDARKNTPGLVRAYLIRETADGSHFVSVSEWDDPEARAAWKQTPGFAKGQGACRALCDDFYGADYLLTVGV